MQAKIADTPIPPTVIKTQTAKGYRRIPETEMNQLDDKLYQACALRVIEDLPAENFRNILETLESYSALTLLYDQINEHIAQTNIGQALPQDHEFIVGILFHRFIHQPFIDQSTDPSSLLEQHTDYSDMHGPHLTRSSAQQLHTDLERVKAKLTDRLELMVTHQSFMLQPLPVFIEDLMFNAFSQDSKDQIARLQEYCDQHQLTTLFDVSQHILSDYISVRYQDPDIGSTIPQANNLEEIIQAISNLKLTQQNNQLVAQLTQAIKEADIEGKRDLSGKLKQAKADLRTDQQIQHALRQYYELPMVWSQLITSRVNRAQSMLEAGAEGDKTTLTLDATPDPEKDANPGKISGDCTEDNPLPFNNPTNRLYNVKVSQENDHIGNIYLLVTTTSSGKATWHLDAIQIPIVFDWDELLVDIFDTMGTLATDQQVAQITINSELHHISNYDSIATTADQIWRQRGSHTCKVDLLTSFSADETTLQGSGEAKVIWQNPNTIH
jgi:hypothetical protein